MKKALILLAVFTLSLTSLMAQEENESSMETLLGNDNLKSSGFGGPVIKFSPFKDEMSILVGGRGGWTINSTFTIGAAGYGMVYGPDVAYTNSLNETVASNMYFGYGGLFLEYINNSDKLIHFTVNTLIGAGGAAYVDKNNDWFYDDHGPDNWDYEPWAAYFVLEPGVTAELNLLKFFRIGAEISYRYMDNIKTNSYFDNSKGLDHNKMNGFSGALVFKFGCF